MAIKRKVSSRSQKLRAWLGIVAAFGLLLLIVFQRFERHDRLHHHEDTFDANGDIVVKK